MMKIPEEAVCSVLEWYRENKRILPWREDPSPYHVLISEIMLQQTRVEAVIDYYHRFLARFPGIASLAAADEDEVRALWQGLGYYRRCENLHRAAVMIMEEYGGEIPADFEKVLALPGIGRYTAGAVLSIGFDLPYPAVDGNVLRILSRLTASDCCVDEEKVRRETERALLPLIPCSSAADFTQALMELGAVICLPNGAPRCADCPWQNMCLGKNRWQELPVRKPKKQRRAEQRTVFLLCCGDEVAVKKRPSRGLLANMWEFPNEKGFFSAGETSLKFGVSPDRVEALGETKHVFSHVEWLLCGFLLRFDQKPGEEGLVWIKKEEIASCAIPSAFSFFKKVL